jgi:hypothetical protein
MRRASLIFNLLPLLAFAQVAPVNHGAWTNNGGGTTISQAFTINSGSNEIAIAYLAQWSTSGGSFTSVTLGGQTMTAACGPVNAGYGPGNLAIGAFYLLSPPTGSQTLAVSFSGTTAGTGMTVNVAVYSGVNQSTPINSGTCQTNHNSSGYASMTVTSSTSDLSVTEQVNAYTNYNPPTDNQTMEAYAYPQGAGWFTCNDHATTPASSVTHTWNSGGNGGWIMLGFDLYAAPPPPTVSFSSCPSSGNYGTASSACTVTMSNATFDGTHTVTIVDSSPSVEPGTFTYAGTGYQGSFTATPSSGSTSFTFTYTPAVVGKRVWALSTNYASWVLGTSTNAYTAASSQPCNFTLTGSGTQSIAATSGWTSTGGCGHSSPTTGDTLAVTASGGTITVTVPNDSAIHPLGTCPANNTTYDVTLTAVAAGSAVLDIQPGAQFYYCGNIKAAGVAATAGASSPTTWPDIKIETGATVYLDEGQATFAHRTVTAANNEWTRLLFGSSTDACTFGPGTAYSCPTTVQAVNVATVNPVLYDPNSTTDSHLFKIYGTAIKGCGSATAGCLTWASGGNSSWSSYSDSGAVYLNGDVFDTTGTVQSMNRFNNVLRLSVAGSHFINDLVGFFSIDNSGTSTAQSCTIAGSYFSGVIGTGNMSGMNCYLTGSALQAGMNWMGIAGSFSGNVYMLNQVNGAADRSMGAPTLNNYYVDTGNTSSNHHVNTTGTVRGNLFEDLVAGNPEGHCNVTSATGGSATVIMLDNLSVKGAGGGNTCQMYGWDPASNGATGMPVAWLDHNGAYGTGVFSWTAMIGHGRYPNQQVLRSMRYNLGWSPSANAYNLAVGMNATGPTNAANAYANEVYITGENHNNWFNAYASSGYGAGVNTNCNPSTSMGTAYDQCTASGTPGAGDTTLNPKLLDSSRGALKWASAMQGQAASVNGFYAALLGCQNLAYCIQQLGWYVRQGYQPTNLGLKGAAQDGGIVGVTGTPGSGYSGACTATITVQDTDDLGTGAAATCAFAGGIPQVTITNPGIHYRMATSAAVTISGTGGSGTSLNVVVSPSDIGPVPITLFAGVAP